jgi:putative serine protease PepD
MTTPHVVRRAFCTSCGAPLEDERCPRCSPLERLSASEASSEAAASPSRRPGPRHSAALVAIAVMAALIVGVTATRSASRAHDEADRTAAALEVLTERQGELDERFDELLSMYEETTTRTGALETQLSSQPDAAATARRAAKAVFTVVTAQGSGSGFVVSSSTDEARLVTNFHVVAETYVNGGRAVKVRRGDQTYDAKIVDVSEANDLALVAVARELPTLSIRQERPAVGAPLLVLGSPLGLGGTVTSGIVSAYRTENGFSYMQFSAPISPGNSGGPVIDDRGNVVGVSVAKMLGGGAEGLGFAIPSDRLCGSLDIC